MKKLFKIIVTALTVAAILASLSANVFAAKSIEKEATIDGICEYTEIISVSESYVVYFKPELKTSDKKWPVIIWANGTLCPPASYTSLLNGLARKGYVVVASNDVMSADGQSQIQQLNYIKNKNTDKNSIFYNKIDTEKVAAAGHSQGGRSTVNAVNACPDFKCGISLAGSNTKSENKTLNLTTPMFFISGGADIIVPAKTWVVPTYNIAKGPAVYACRKSAIHTTCWVHPTEYVTYIDLWCKAYLNNDNTALAAFKKDGKLSSDSDWQNVTMKNISDFSSTGSVLSDGNAAIIGAIALVAIAAVIVLAVFRKKTSEKQVVSDENE